jgi:hypothetical protein
MTCMYVRLLGPCFKTGEKISSYTSLSALGRTLTRCASLDGEATGRPRAREPGLGSPDCPRHALPRNLSRSRVVLGAVWRGATPPTLFYEPRCLVQTGRISCSFSSSNEVLFSFPLRYLFAIGYHAFIFSLRWPAPPIFSQHFQASLLAGHPLAARNHQVVCNALCKGRSSPYCGPLPCEDTPQTTGPNRSKAEGIRSRANPSSLAATRGISIDFFSSADLYA